MAPYNYEKQFKDKLEKRRLQPAPDAWGKLSQRLDDTGKKHNNKSYWYIGLAASIVGLLFLGLQFWLEYLKTENTPELVNTPKVKIIKEIHSDDLNNHIAKEELDMNILKTKNSVSKNEKSKAESIQKNGSISPTQIAINDSRSEKAKKENQTIKPTEEPIIALSFEEQKIQDVVAKVEALKQENDAVTDDDIDALLIQAQKEIQLNKLINEKTGVVDAEALLHDVEADLDQSFRSKVFEAIKSSYNSVKTAVTQRND